MESTAGQTGGGRYLKAGRDDVQGERRTWFAHFPQRAEVKLDHIELSINPLQHLHPD